jgi:hypothetical protein
MCRNQNCADQQQRHPAARDRVPTGARLPAGGRPRAGGSGGGTVAASVAARHPPPRPTDRGTASGGQREGKGSEMLASYIRGGISLQCSGC